LDFQKVEILPAGRIQKVNLRHLAKFRGDAVKPLSMAICRFFFNILAASAILNFCTHV